MKIAIFGTVGAGKTTLIKNLQSSLPSYEIFWEPMEKNPYFSELYTTNMNVQDLTYKMEIWMLSARMKQLRQARLKANVIFDRGVMDTIIFADTNHEQQKISNRDWNVYADYFDSVIIPSLFVKNHQAYDLVVYLQISDEIAIKQIQKRGIKEELQVDHQFWILLNKTYEKWYQRLKEKVPFYVLDANKEDSQELATELITYLKKREK